MAWEWVAPVMAGTSGVAGVFFTWLAGAQGRTHAERMVHEAQVAAERFELRQEKRNAYLQGIKLCEVDLRLIRYKREGRTDKLRQLEAIWPVDERRKEITAVLAAVQVFGSAPIRAFVEDYLRAFDAGDEQRTREIYERGLGLVRRELGIELELGA